MKQGFLLLLMICLIACSNGHEINQVVELSCGQCNFDMKKPKGCDLAIRIEEKSYYVDGFSIDDFGDAHDEKTGFCEVIRKGLVSGTIIDGRFAMTLVDFKVPDSVVTH